MDSNASSEAPVPGHNQRRQTVSISKKLAWGAGAMSTAGFLGISAALYERFYSREEGLAAERNVARIEETFKQQLADKSDDLKLVINLRFDEILRTMRAESESRIKSDDKQNAEIDNLKLIVLTPKKGEK